MNFLVGWHILDIFFLLLGCFFLIKGAFRGFVGEILSFGGLILSVWAGFRHSDTIGFLLGRATGLSREVAQVLSVVLVWLVVSILFALLRRVMKQLIEFTSLGGIDRVLGILTGLLKTVIVIYMVLISGLLLAPVIDPTWMAQSDVLVYSGRKWPEVRQLLINIGALPKRTELPDKTLERILRLYRSDDDFLPYPPYPEEAGKMPLHGAIASGGGEKGII